MSDRLLRVRWLAFGPLCVLLSGCLIWPVSEVTYPQINGLLLANGSPAPAVPMSSCARRAPRPTVVSSRTDSAGRFMFQRQARRRYITGIFGDPVYQTCLQATRDGREFPWVKQTIGVFPDRLTLQCVLDERAMQCTEVRP
jgi:hypothetical protein